MLLRWVGGDHGCSERWTERTNTNAFAFLNFNTKFFSDSGAEYAYSEPDCVSHRNAYPDRYLDSDHYPDTFHSAHLDSIHHSDADGDMDLDPRSADGHLYRIPDLDEYTLTSHVNIHRNTDASVTPKNLFKF